MYPWIILLVLCSLYFQSLEFLCVKFEYEKDGRCCSFCRPGHRLSRDCTEHNQTVCIPCLAREYHDKFHRESSCMLHKECNENLGFEMISEGTPTSNILCRCQLGKHCSSEACETCVLSKVCGPGEGVVKMATSYSDTQCSPCEKGTYSNTTSERTPCIYWSKCGDGEEIIQPGTPTTDVVCRAPEPSAPDGKSNAWIYILLVVVVFGVIVLPGIIIFRRLHRKNKKNKQNPPKEINQQHLIKEVNEPEEYQDDQDITMQGLPVAQEQGKDYHMSQEEV